MNKGKHWHSAMHANWPKAKTSATAMPDTKTKTQTKKRLRQQKDSALHANCPKAKTSATDLAMPDKKTK